MISNLQDKSKFLEGNSLSVLYRFQSVDIEQYLAKEKKKKSNVGRMKGMYLIMLSWNKLSVHIHKWNCLELREQTWFLFIWIFLISVLLRFYYISRRSFLQWCLLTTKDLTFAFKQSDLSTLSKLILFVMHYRVFYTKSLPGDIFLFVSFCLLNTTTNVYKLSISCSLWSLFCSLCILGMQLRKKSFSISLRSKLGNVFSHLKENTVKICHFGTQICSQQCFLYGHFVFVLHSYKLFKIFQIGLSSDVQHRKEVRIFFSPMKWLWYYMYDLQNTMFFKKKKTSK